jgi:hypothetical protein
MRKSGRLRAGRGRPARGEGPWGQTGMTEWREGRKQGPAAWRSPRRVHALQAHRHPTGIDLLKVRGGIKCGLRAVHSVRVCRLPCRAGHMVLAVHVSVQLAGRMVPMLPGCMVRPVPGAIVPRITGRGCRPARHGGRQEVALFGGRHTAARPVRAPWPPTRWPVQCPGPTTARLQHSPSSSTPVRAALTGSRR